MIVRWAATGLVLALGLTLPAQAEKAWTLAAQTAKQSFLVLVSPDRVQGPPELRKIEVLIVKHASTKYQQVAAENDWEINCVTKSYRWTGSRVMGPDAKIFSTEWKPTDWSPLQPGAAVTYMSGFACADTKPLGPEYPNTKAAIVAYWKEEPATN